ncbi:MAG: TlpA family protein disulfide reductase [Crocinitomicaceae bacterium]|nr:TlpA family protein disulfide reductase [Crocinitomicaceae bacterium]
MKRNILYLFILLAVFAGWWYYYKVPADVKFSLMKTEFPEGSYGTLSDFTDGPAVIHFYAAWCGPCMRELPAIRSFIDRFPGIEAKVFLVTDDPWDKIENVRKQIGEKINIVRINSLKEIGIHSIPITYFLDKELESKKEQMGACPWEDENFLKEIQPIIQF